jgi:hypothetical protein
MFINAPVTEPSLEEALIVWVGPPSRPAQRGGGAKLQRMCGGLMGLEGFRRLPISPGDYAI